MVELKCGFERPKLFIKDDTPNERYSLQMCGLFGKDSDKECKHDNCMFYQLLVQILKQQNK